MPVICPAVLAKDKDEYHRQMEKVANFAERIQIDLTDGEFAKSTTIKPKDAWWPVGVKADFHLMYRNPKDALDVILEHRPNMVIVHAESDGSFTDIVNRLKSLGVKAGVALLAATPVDLLLSSLGNIDHVLIFSGSLGEFGGHADLGLLSKVEALKQSKADLEIGWDGGVNDRNIAQLASGGVDVFNVGGFIQNAPDPGHAYKSLDRIAQETGTT
jgi:ribulose-phosphate 3-epimerase